MNRHFVALWPDDATRRRIAAAVAPRVPPGCRPVPAANLHVTLVFLGALLDTRLPEVAQCMQAVDFAPFAVSFDTTGHFTGARVAWAGMTVVPDALQRLQHGLSAALDARGFAVDRRPFVPHLTIARPCREPPGPWVGPAVDWRIDGFALCRSVPTRVGVRYSVVAVRSAESMR